jgi:hypothetical protein
MRSNASFSDIFIRTEVLFQLFLFSDAEFVLLVKQCVAGKCRDHVGVTFAHIQPIRVQTKNAARLKMQRTIVVISTFQANFIIISKWVSRIFC